MDGQGHPGAAWADGLDHVVVLLTDIEGSTPLWERQPEQMYVATLRHEALITAAVEGHGGRVLRSRGEGDSTFSVFSTVAEAVAAAGQAQAALRDEPWTTDAPLRVRMSVHVGIAARTAATDYYGPELNRAARIRSAAQGGEVLLSDAAAADLAAVGPGEHATVSLGLHDLRGIGAPEHLHRLVLAGDGPEATVGRGRPPLPRGLAEGPPVVGREAALAVLEAARATAEGGATRVAVVSGDPGIGKTSTVAAAARAAHASGATVLLARCEQDLPGLGPVVAALLRPALGSLGVDDLRHLPSVRWLARVLPELGELADRAAVADAPAAIAPEDERAALFEAVLELVALLRRRGPLLLVLDDLHWADPALLLLVRRLARDERVAGLLVVATCRAGTIDVPESVSGLVADLRRDGLLVPVALEGLDATAVARLVERAAVTTAEGTSSLAAVLEEVAAGNPLFVVEVLRQLERRGAARAAAWTAADLIAAVGLPDGVREVLDDRITRVGPEARTTLVLTALLGARVELAHLLDVARRTGLKEVLDGVEEAVAADLLLDHGGALEFPHALVREAVLATTTPTRRFRLHLEVAEALEGIDGADPEAIARHLVAAGPVAEPVEVARRLFEAGLAAADSLAFEAALEWFAQAEERLAPLAGTEALRATIAIEEGWLLSYLSRLDERRAAAARSIDLALAAGTPVLLRDAVAAGAFANELGERDDAWAAQCAAAATQLPEGHHIRLLLEAMAAQHGLLDGVDDDVEGRARRAVEAAREAGDLTSLHHALRVVASALVLSPRFDDYLVLAHELATMPQPRDAVRVGVDYVHPLLLRGTAHLALGQLDAFDAVVEELAGMAPARPWGQTFTHHTWRAVRSMLAGRWEEAEGHLTELALASDRPNAQGAWAANTILLARERGGAVALAPFVAEAIPTAPGISAYRPALALLLAEGGELDAARAAFADAFAAFATLPLDTLRTMTVDLLAQVAVLLEDHQAAATLYDQLLPWSGTLLCQAGASFHLGAADRDLGALAALLGRPVDAERHLTAALDLEAQLDARPSLVRTRLALARARAREGRLADPSTQDEVRRALVDARALGMADHLGWLEALVVESTSGGDAGGR